MKKEKKKKFAKFKLWWKNMGGSINELWKEAAKDIPGVALADGTIVSIKEARKRQLKGVLLKDVKHLNAKMAVSLKKYMDSEVMDDVRGARDNFIAFKKEFVGRAKSGALLRNNNRRETGRFNKENKSFAELQSRLDAIEDFDFDDEDFGFDEDSYGELYNIGGIMIKENLHNNLLKLKQQAHAESLSMLSNMSKLNNAIEELRDYVESKVAFCEGLEKSEINDVIIKDATDGIKERAIIIAKTISTEPTVANSYSDVIGTAIAVAVETEANYEMDAPTEENIDALLENIDNTKSEVEEVSPSAAKIVEQRLGDTIADLHEVKDDLTFDPIEVKDKNVVAAAERHIKSAGEDFTGIGTIINSVMMVPALLTNVYLDKRNRRFAAKYGTSATIKQPVLTTNSLSKETINKMCKALEVKYALQLKSTLESTVAAMDGGLVSKRLRDAGIASKAKIDVKDAKLYAANPLSYDQLVGVFSEDQTIKTDYLGYTNTDTLHIIPAGMSLFRRYAEELYLTHVNDYLTGRGEAGIEIEERRTALPTYLTVSIKYDAPKSIVSFERQNVANDTVVGIALNPKVVTSNDLVTVLKENKFSKIKVDKDERNFAKRFSNILRFWRSKKSNTPQGKVLATSSMKNIIDKVANIKTPLFHLMISDSDYVLLRNSGIDLKTENDYKDLMGALPIISVTIINEDNGIVLHSDSKNMGYIKKNISDFIDSTAELEKHLRSEIKFRHNL